MALCCKYVYKFLTYAVVRLAILFPACASGSSAMRQFPDQRRGFLTSTEIFLTVRQIPDLRGSFLTISVIS